MKSLKKNNVLIIILFAIAVFMSVGFAVLSTTLNINGTVKVKSQTWDIHFENVAITDGSVTAIKDAVIANEAATLVEYEIELSKPGDYYEFIVDAVNDGTLDSMIEMVTISGIEGNEEYINYQATYLDGTEIKIGDALNAGTSETYKIRIEYKKDIENLPTEDITLNLVYGVTYSQSKGGELIANYYTLTGTAYGVDGLPLTEGEIEVHSKVITAPINSDGTFVIKNVPVGKHEIYIKDNAGQVINSGTFTLQTGDKTTIENNIVTAFSNGNIELNIKILEESVILKNICDYEAGQTWEFAYTGDIQEFNVPCAGTYQLEVWGAQGGSGNHGVGGQGGYSKGNAIFTTDINLYIVIGGRGENVNESSEAIIYGYNGGGSKYYHGGGGGGATHIATAPGLLSVLESNKEAILIVAGGGGGGGTWVSNNTTLNGGAGGGTIGGDAYAYNKDYSSANNALITRGGGGTQTSGGVVLGSGGYYAQVGTFGQGATSSNYNGAGGGGGYYGGASGGYYNGATPGGGGSGYIGGVTDGETIAGNATMPTQDGTSTMTGNTGNGYAKITLVSY